MSIVIKARGSRRYAYRARREAGKVVQRYIGSMDDPKTLRIVENELCKYQVPKHFYRFFWDIDPSTLDTKKRSQYVVGRILEVGNLDAFGWLREIYPTSYIRGVNETVKGISDKSRNFWKIWLEQKYVY